MTKDEAVHALEGALEALIRHQGLLATDRPELWDKSLAWTIDEADRIAAAQHALSAPPDQEKQ